MTRDVLAPQDSPALLGRLLDLLPTPLPAPARGSREVPDPYTGGPEAFEQVLDLIDIACEALIDALPPVTRAPS